MPQESFTEGTLITRQIPGEFNFTVKGIDLIKLLQDDLRSIYSVLNAQMENAGHNDSGTRNHALRYGVDFKKGIGRLLFQYTLSRTFEQFAMVLSWHFNPDSSEIQRVILSPCLNNLGYSVGLEEVDVGIQNIQLLRDLEKIESLCRGVKISSEIRESVSLQEVLCRVAGISLKEKSDH